MAPDRFIVATDRPECTTKARAFCEEDPLAIRR
jgi:hypothetical protein